MADKIGTDEYGEILIYQTDDGQTNIEVKIEDDTVWLTQQQLTELYQCSKSNISEHIKHIFEEGELDKDSVVRKFRTTADDGKTYNVTYYNLDMIISLGYRIKSGIAKNYLDESELKVLNNLVSGYFDLAEINAIEHKPMYMDDYVKQLDSVLSSGNRKLLTGSGSVSHKQVLEKAKSEYRKYQEITLTPVEKAYLESIKEVSEEVKRR
ncbi:cell filamentation protein Fic [Agathobacter rectalis]|uniref:Cell filamentation protein Fic n=1 Tax=Agathobacter rectalis TaxID=39491 RepID=A0A414A3Y1_9FIRM|nr:RhuM family protein [Agathobacter rectalis]RHC40249.1 cell filamentation protein Fic [Agathobacter rectalis]